MLGEGQLFQTFNIIKTSEKGGKVYTTPVNSQKKLDEVELILLDEKTGRISVKPPYTLTNYLHFSKVLCYESGELKEGEE